MDIVDRAQEIQERLTEMALQPRRQKRNPNFAIDEGRLCKKCGKTIPAERLKEVPFAVRCIQCQTEHETGR